MIEKWLKAVFLLIFLQSYTARSCQFFGSEFLGQDRTFYGAYPKGLCLLVEPWDKSNVRKPYQPLYLAAVLIIPRKFWPNKEIRCQIKLCPFFESLQLPSGVTVPVPCNKIGHYGIAVEPNLNAWPDHYNIIFSTINPPEEHKFTDAELGILPGMEQGKANLIGNPAVLCPSGPRKISELRPGDSVFALNTETGTWTIDHVILAEKGWCTKAVKISYIERAITEQSIKDKSVEQTSVVTGIEQKFWSQSKDGWTTAGELVVGDFVMVGPAPGKACKFLDIALITKIEQIEHDDSAWRLELLKHHNFLDAETGLLLHNTNNKEPLILCNDWSVDFYQFFKHQDIQRTLQRTGRISCEHYDQTDSATRHPHPLIYNKQIKLELNGEMLVLPMPHRYVAIKVPFGYLPTEEQSQQLRSMCAKNFIEQLCIYQKAPPSHKPPNTGQRSDWPKNQSQKSDWSVSGSFSFSIGGGNDPVKLAQDLWDYSLNAKESLYKEIIPGLRATRLNDLLRQNNERQQALLEKNLKEVPEKVIIGTELEENILEALCDADIPENVPLISIGQFLQAGLFDQTFNQIHINISLSKYLADSGIDNRSQAVQELYDVYYKIDDAIRSGCAEKIDFLESRLVDLIKQSHDQSSQSGRGFNYFKAMAIPAACIALCAGLELCRDPAFLATFNPIKFCLCVAKHATIFGAASMAQRWVGEFLEDKPALNGGTFGLAMASAVLSAQQGSLFCAPPGHLSPLDLVISGGLASYQSNSPEEFRENFVSLVNAAYGTSLVMGWIGRILKTEKAKKIITAGTAKISQMFNGIGKSIRGFGQKINRAFGLEQIPAITEGIFPSELSTESHSKPNSIQEKNPSKLIDTGQCGTIKDNCPAPPIKCLDEHIVPKLEKGSAYQNGQRSIIETEKVFSKTPQAKALRANLEPMNHAYPFKNTHSRFYKALQNVPEWGIDKGDIVYVDVSKYHIKDPHLEIFSGYKSKTVKHGSIINNAFKAKSVYSLEGIHLYTKTKISEITGPNKGPRVIMDQMRFSKCLSANSNGCENCIPDTMIDQMKLELKKGKNNPQ